MKTPQETRNRWHGAVFFEVDSLDHLHVNQPGAYEKHLFLGPTLDFLKQNLAGIGPSNLHFSQPHLIYIKVEQSPTRGSYPEKTLISCLLVLPSLQPTILHVTSSHWVIHLYWQMVGSGRVPKNFFSLGWWANLTSYWLFSQLLFPRKCGGSKKNALLNTKLA